jgi:hypothetical protein
MFKNPTRTAIKYCQRKRSSAELQIFFTYALEAEMSDRDFGRLAADLLHKHTFDFPQTYLDEITKRTLKIEPRTTNP